jgi:RNA polymerase sigma-70 factor, ECF subfamily
MEDGTEKRSNETWLSELRKADGEALADLRAYICRSLQTALSGRAGQGDVEDFAQQALTRILKSLDTFRGDSRFTTWATSVAIRIAFGELRRKQWGAVSLDALLEGGQAPSPVKAPEALEKASGGEVLGVLLEGIDTVLSERQRTVVLAELEGMPTSVLSKELGVSTGALYKMHHDARKKLRSFLEQRGFRGEDFKASGIGTGSPP